MYWRNRFDFLRGKLDDIHHHNGTISGPQYRALNKLADELQHELQTIFSGRWLILALLNIGQVNRDINEIENLANIFDYNVRKLGKLRIA
jgi:hypothetical protein